MSGIAGVVSMDGAPADGALAARMAAFMAYRGPDGQASRVMAGCALAHARLLTGDEDAPAGQPFSRDGQLWITADARLDARNDLARELRGAGENAEVDAPAADLLLRAYRAWGVDCVSRLLGDFAFAVWDAPRRRLFCARDHFGVKPFYYAAPPREFVFSNTLDCVLLHPGVNRELDEAAVADFLVHGFQMDTGATVRRAVRALPPAHSLVVENGEVRAWRWWSPPVEEPLALRSPGEYVERFVELFGRAVADRTPPGRVSVMLSGGLDSTSVAAVARRERPSADVRAFTAVYERLIAEQEGRFASLAAAALRVPVTFTAADDVRLFEGFADDERFGRPEPVNSPLLAIEVRQWTRAAAHAPVLLTGFGGDAVLRETRSRLARLARRGRLLRAAGEAATYARLHRRLPRPGLRTLLREGETRRAGDAFIPSWVDADFARRVGLVDRVAAQNERPPSPHPARPEAYDQLVSPLWPHLFTYLDPGVTRFPVEQRHPFFDVRLVRFLLSVPPAQWYNDKGLLRIGMRGLLPRQVLRRPKSPLPGNPVGARRERDGEAWLGGLTLGPETAPYVDLAAVPRSAGGRGLEDGQPLWMAIRPLALSLWLRSHA